MKSVAFAILILVILAFSTFTILPLQMGHALFVGTICFDPAISQATAPTNCSTTPVFLGGSQFTTGSTFTLEVDVAGSDTTDGFEVAVMTDPNVLLPLSANITGAGTLMNILGSPLTLVNCINNGVGGSANNCVPGIDGNGVAHMAVTSLGGLSNPPTTGRLMYVNYQVKSLTTSSPIVYVQNADPTICGASSHPPDCAFITNGGGGFDPENVQTASFFNVATFTMTANPQSFRVIPGASGTSTITLTSIGGLSGTITLSATVNPTGPAESFNTTTVKLTPGLVNASLLTVSTVLSTPTGSYSVNVTGTLGTVTRFAVVTVAVGEPDFSITPSPSVVATLQGRSNNSVIRLSSLNTFNGTILLTISGGPTGTSFSLNTTSVKLTSGITNSSLLTITTTSSTPLGTYTITVTGTNDTSTLSHDAVVTLKVVLPDFGISASQSSFTIPPGGPVETSTITLVSQYTFNGTIDLTVSISPPSPDIMAVATPLSVMIDNTAQGKISGSTLAITVGSSAIPRTYMITISGNNRTTTLTHFVTITLIVPPPDFGLAAESNSLIIQAGNTNSTTITVNSLNLFTGTISFAANSTTTSPTPNFGPASITLTSTITSSTTTLTVSTTETIVPGEYTMTLNATSAGLLHQLNITIIVTPPLPRIQLGTPSISVTSITAGKPVTLTVKVTNTGNVNVNITVVMDVNNGNANVTVDRHNIILATGQSTIVTLQWDTTNYATGNYNVYARVMGMTSSNVNQASAPLAETVNAAPVDQGFQLPGGYLLWIAIAAVAIIIVASFFLLRRRTPRAQASL